MPRGKAKSKEAPAEEPILREEPVKATAGGGRAFTSLGQLAGQLGKHYKRPHTLRTGEDIRPIRKVPLGEPMLDNVTDGGIPLSRVTEFLGEEHSGKTRNLLVAMAAFQRYCFGCYQADALTTVWLTEAQKPAAQKGVPVVKTCTCRYCDTPKTTVQALIDWEGTADRRWMRQLGVDLGGVIYAQPKLPTEVVSIVEALLRNPEVGLIGVDSVGSMSRDSEVEKAAEDIHMNQNAVFLNMALRKWQAALNANASEDLDSPTTLIVINQSYQTLSTYSTEVAQGGRGLRHGKGLSVKLKVTEKVYQDPKERTTILGVHVRAENLKNKTGMPYRRGEYYLNLNPSDPELRYCGVDVPTQLLELGMQMGLIQARGAWVYYQTPDGEEQKWNGKAAMIADLRGNPEVLERMRDGIYASLTGNE